ncbi:hypothetical protein RCL_jg25807.t1 [Rhizophagus clarus]|uniref:Uncharacterized protein n=1 Tax=Rhizophagus clarus TaxID=94130 RepID=A0A8H3LVF6_9GLOM|nr:hypothetical protein RCL_jg25807.t1 [Rhizophagus clarus]
MEHLKVLTNPLSYYDNAVKKTGHTTIKSLYEEIKEIYIMQILRKSFIAIFSRKSGSEEQDETQLGALIAIDEN